MSLNDLLTRTSGAFRDAGRELQRGIEAEERRLASTNKHQRCW